MRTVEVTPDEPAVLDAWYAVTVAAERAEMGERAVPWELADVVARHRDAASYRSHLLAAVTPDGVTVGAAELLLPLRDNPHLARLAVAVHPDHRRRGAGSLLVAAAETLAAGDGRSTVEAESTRSPDREDVAAPFAARLGYRRVQTELHSDLDLPPGLDLDALLAPVESEAGAPAGYRLETWWDEVPERWLEGQAVLQSRMSTDAPLGGSATLPEVWDAERVRESLLLAAAGGRRVVEVVAVHEASATLAGYTRLRVDPADPAGAEQEDTLVLREHRGHRLGMALKAAALRALLSEVPDVRRVSTWNAQENAPMLRVNRAMGFATVGLCTLWQRRLAGR